MLPKMIGVKEEEIVLAEKINLQAQLIDAKSSLAAHKEDTVNDIDRDKVDEIVLALLQLTLHDHYRAWKGVDWETLNRLYENGLIENPRSKAKSVVLTEEGLANSARFFQYYFGGSNEIQDESLDHTVSAYMPTRGELTTSRSISSPHSYSTAQSSQSQHYCQRCIEKRNWCPI